MAPAVPCLGLTAVLDIGGASEQTRHARRIYVGGLGEVTEAEIAEFFKELVYKLRPWRGLLLSW